MGNIIDLIGALINIWGILGLFTGALFLVLYLLSKDDVKKKRYKRWFIISFAGVLVWFITNPLFLAYGN